MKDKDILKKGIDGKDFDPNVNKIEIIEGVDAINIPSEEGEKRRLTPFQVPGMSFGHSLWRLMVHKRDELKSVVAFSIERYDKENIRKEGAVKVIWWMK